jgi:hypothetical protein
MMLLDGVNVAGAQGSGVGSACRRTVAAFVVTALARVMAAMAMQQILVTVARICRCMGKNLVDDRAPGRVEASQCTFDVHFEMIARYTTVYRVLCRSREIPKDIMMSAKAPGAPHGCDTVQYPRPAPSS